MDDFTTPPEKRTRDGSAADRRMTTINAAATGAGAGLAIGWADWFFLQCFTTGHFVWATPSKDLLEVSAPILLLPVGVWVARVLSLIGDIITNRLQRDAGN